MPDSSSKQSHNSPTVEPIPFPKITEPEKSDLSNLSTASIASSTYMKSRFGFLVQTDADLL